MPSIEVNGTLDLRQFAGPTRRVGSLKAAPSIARETRFDDRVIPNPTSPRLNREGAKLGAKGTHVTGSAKPPCGFRAAVLPVLRSSCDDHLILLEPAKSAHSSAFRAACPARLNTRPLVVCSGQAARTTPLALAVLQSPAVGFGIRIQL